MYTKSVEVLWNVRRRIDHKGNAIKASPSLNIYLRLQSEDDGMFQMRLRFLSLLPRLEEKPPLLGLRRNAHRLYIKSNEISIVELISFTLHNADLEWKFTEKNVFLDENLWLLFIILISVKNDFCCWYNCNIFVYLTSGLSRSSWFRLVFNDIHLNIYIITIIA